jgi:hypothetical protein
MANVTTPNTDPPRLASRTRPRNHPFHAPGPLEKASINHHTENGFGKECSTRLFFQISWVMKPGTPYAEEDCALRASREFDPAQRGTRLGQ